MVMTFDEYVKAMEEMLRKSNEEANVSLINKNFDARWEDWMIAE